MIKSMSEFQKVIRENENIYFVYMDDVCEATIDLLIQSSEEHRLRACISLDELVDSEVRGYEVIKVEQVDKESCILMTCNTKQDEISSKFRGLELRKVEYLDENFKFYALKRLKNKRRGEDTEFLINKMRDQLLKFVPRPYMEYMVFNILDHCNLKCKGCDHFACVSDEYIVPYEKLHKDIERMSEILHGDNVMKIAVMGGEPLLHPELLEILKDVRKYFPYAIIRLTTNGLLLLQQKEEFWQTCREYDITIVNTKYPIQIDHQKIREMAKKQGVKFQYFEGTGDDTVKTSSKKTITLDGTNDPVKSFAQCYISNYGNFVMEGKFYGCPFSCQSYRIFNKKFDKNLRMTEKDYLDIYKVRDMQELFEFSAKPRPYCRYCSGIDRWHEWERTKKDISEWV